MLNGVRVLDVGGWGVGPVACCLLGCLGADVIRFEPPKFDGLYHTGTKQDGVGTAYITSHFNKRNIVLDLKKDEDREIGLKVASTADVIVENHPPGVMEKLQFDYESVRKVNPNVIYCASSSYGSKGPLANSSSNDPMMQLFSGYASMNGTPGSKGEMCRYVVSLDYTTSLSIVQSVLVALMARSGTGRGQKIEMSQFESVLALESTKIAEFFASGKSPVPMGTANPNVVPSQAFKTFDNNYVNVSVHREEYWPNLCRALALKDLEKNQKFATNADRVKNRDELIPILEDKFAKQPARWWLILLRREGVPVGSINTVDEIYNDPHLRDNKMIRKLNTHWGPALFANFPLKFSNPPKPIKIKAPVKPDKNRKEILAEIAKPARRPTSANQLQLKEKGKILPLKGLKVLELSEEIAGPFCSQQLSDAGAEVVKIEPIGGDWSRYLGEKINGESALWLSINRGKKSIALDLREAKAREIVQKLVKSADVLIESFGPKRAEAMDIGYAQLSKDNPKLIYCAISPFGSSGPYAKYPASELELQGLAGYQYHLGQTGEPPVRIGADLVNTASGMYSFIGILSALFNRNESGIGQKIDCAMMSNAIAMLCYVITADYNPDLPDGWHFTGPFDRPETGYQTKNGPVLFGMPMLPDKMQSAWEYFIRQIGIPELLDDPNFRERGMRNVGIGRNAQEFKPAIEDGLKNVTRAEIKKIMEGLSGSSFAPFNTIQEVLEEHQINAVNMVEVLNHPVAGEIKVTGIPWKLMDTPLKIQGAPPTLGQHTDEIMHSLGYSTQEIKKLREMNIIA